MAITTTREQRGERPQMMRVFLAVTVAVSTLGFFAATSAIAATQRRMTCTTARFMGRDSERMRQEAKASGRAARCRMPPPVAVTAPDSIDAQQALGGCSAPTGCA